MVLGGGCRKCLANTHLKHCLCVCQIVPIWERETPTHELQIGQSEYAKIPLQGLTRGVLNPRCPPMDQQTIDTYNKMAKGYDEETANFWEIFPRTFLDEFIKLSGKKIIDIGSGPGRDGLLIKQAGKEIICIDASGEMIRLSFDNGLESVLASFDNLPFENNSFDGAWSYTSLLHTPKKLISTPLQEIFRVLKPSGIFALGLIEGKTEEYKESSGVNMPRWFSFYQKEEIENLCKQNGFELIHFETFKPRSKNYMNFIFRKI